MHKLTISFVRGDPRRFALQKWWLYIVPKKSYRVRNTDGSLIEIIYGEVRWIEIMALYTFTQPSDQIFTTPLKSSLINDFANPS